MREPVKIFNGENFPCVFPTPNENEILPPITTCLINIIEDAETLFGKRSSQLMFLGIEFYDGDRPQLLVQNRYAIMQLDQSAFLDIKEACSQCAHEFVHLLSPVERKETTFLEEGLATYFEKRVREAVGRSKLIIDKYEQAFTSVQKLLAIDQVAIFKLRSVQPTISKITKEQLLTEYPGIGGDSADLLASKFYDDEDTLANEDDTKE